MKKLAWRAPLEQAIAKNYYDQQVNQVYATANEANITITIAA